MKYIDEENVLNPMRNTPETNPNEFIVLQFLNRLIKSVEKLQSNDFKDYGGREVAKIVSSARFLARASACGYWLEGCDLELQNHQKKRYHTWYPEQWFLFSTDARREMRKSHKVGKGRYLYRVVSEFGIVDAKMDFDPKYQSLMQEEEIT